MSRSRTYFLHDSCAHQDLKMQRLLHDHGAEGYGIFWMLCEVMRNIATYSVRVSDLTLIAFQIRVEVEKLQRIIDTCVEVKLLTLENDHYFAPKLVADAQKYEAKRALTNERLKRYRNAEETRSQRETSISISNTRSRSNSLGGKVGGAPPPDRKQFGEGGHVWLSEADHEKLVQRFGATFADRCIEKLDAWVAQKPNTERKRKGMNGAASIRSWVIASVSEEQAKSEQIKGGYQSKMAAKMARIDQL